MLGTHVLGASTTLAFAALRPFEVPNALSTSTSPYLRQHADNPVDWRR